MQFDLFTFLASLFNFVVLLVALRFLLFKRVTNAMDEREERITSTWEEADQKQEDADKLIAEYERYMEDAEEERAQLLEEAKRGAEKHRQQLIEDARQEIANRRDEWAQSLAAHQEELLRTIYEQVADATVASTRGVIVALADERLERTVVTRLVGRLGDGEESDLLAAMHHARTVVTTSAELAEETRQHVQERLLTMGEPSAVTFETDQRLLCGARIIAGDQELRWSAHDALADVQAEIAQIITAEVNEAKQVDEQRNSNGGAANDQSG